MSYKPHPIFRVPEDTTQRIWRYMNITKLVSLLHKRALFFPQVEVLAHLDPYEGSYSDATVEFIRNLTYDSIPEEERQQHFPNEQSFQFYKDAHYQIMKRALQERTVTFINSWHAQEYESAAMWSQYVWSGEGIAIQSTFARLIDSFATYSEYDIHVGYVTYLDYYREAIPFTNLLYPFIMKRRSYEHEKELRALIWTPQHGKNNIDLNKYEHETGLYVPVDLATLIEAVYVAPSTSDWQFDAISGLLSAFGLPGVARQSDLTRKPLL